MTNLKIKVNTKIFEDNKILQEVFTEQDNKIEYLSRVVSDTKEVHLMNALIKLGWTPPQTN